MTIYEVKWKVCIPVGARRDGGMLIEKACLFLTKDDAIRYLDDLNSAAKTIGTHIQEAHIHDREVTQPASLTESCT